MRYLAGIMLVLVSALAYAIDENAAIEVAKAEFGKEMSRDFGFMSNKIESIEIALSTIREDGVPKSIDGINYISRYSVYYDDMERNKEYIKKLTGRLFWSVTIKTVEGLPLSYRIDYETAEPLY